MLHSTMTTTYRIAELAREFGITPRAMRFYEDQGILNPTRQGANRIYSGRDRGRLRLALRARRLGFTLAAIRGLFDLYDKACDDVSQLDAFLVRLGEHRALLQQQREDIEAMLAETDFFESQCRRLLAQRDEHDQAAA